MITVVEFRAKKATGFRFIWPLINYTAIIVLIKIADWSIRKVYNFWFSKLFFYVKIS